MSGLHWLLAAALAAPDGAAAFPCDRLGDELLEVYERFEAPPARSPAAVEVKRKAVLFESRAPLVARTFALADPALAGGKTLVFRPYRSGAESLVCTRGRSDSAFGAGDQDAHFLLRCLADRDGDGRYDAFSRRVRLVRADRMPRTLPPAARLPEVPALIPLPLPLALVERPGLADPTNSGFEPRALMRISVARVDGDTVELRFSGQLANAPDHVAAMFRAGSEEAVYSIPMTAGATIPIGGTRIRFGRSGRKWTAAALDGFGREPRLICSGSVAEVGDTFTILGAGRQAIVPRSSLPRGE